MMDWWARFGENYRLFRGITPWDDTDAPWRMPHQPALHMCNPPVPLLKALRWAFINSVCDKRWYLAWLRWQCGPWRDFEIRMLEKLLRWMERGR